jgi:cell division transport system ATP-binding protein
MIIFEKVSKVYPSKVALEGVNLTINSKEFVTIVGQSGAGKSTLLKLLIAEELPSEGRVVMDDIDIATLKASELPFLRRKIGAIFQDFKLLSNKTVFENVSFALEVAGKAQEDINETVPQVLELVGLNNRLDVFPHQLSGGEKQRVAIARALVLRPDIIVADEPTGNLDPLNTWDVIRLLVKINELGTTVILATHNREIVNTLSKRVISIDKGKIVRDEENGRYIL